MPSFRPVKERYYKKSRNIEYPHETAHESSHIAPEGLIEPLRTYGGDHDRNQERRGKYTRQLKRASHISCKLFKAFLPVSLKQAAYDGYRQCRKAGDGQIQKEVHLIILYIIVLIRHEQRKYCKKYEHVYFGYF